MRWWLAGGLVSLSIGSALAAAAGGTAPSTAGQACTSRVPGDFDGDRRRDMAVVSTSGRSCDSTRGAWSLVVRLSSGERLRIPLTRNLSVWTTRCFPCRAFAAPDFNADGKAEIEVSVGRGASQEQVAVFEVGGGRIYRLRLFGSTAPFVLYYGASIRFGSDVVCRTSSAGARQVVQLSWSNAMDAAGRSHLREETFVLDLPFFRRLSSLARYRPRSEGYPPRARGTDC